MKVVLVAHFYVDILRSTRYLVSSHRQFPLCKHHWCLFVSNYNCLESMFVMCDVFSLSYHGFFLLLIVNFFNLIYIYIHIHIISCILYIFIILLYYIYIKYIVFYSFFIFVHC